MRLPLGRAVLICEAILASPASAASASLAAGNRNAAVIASEAPDFNDIVLGPDGALWVTEYNNGVIGRFTPGGSLGVFAANGTIVPFSQHADRTRLALRGHLTQYPLPDRSSQPAQIAVGSDHALWFSEFFAGKIGRITTNGRLTEIALPRLTGSKSQMRRNPWGITAGPDKNLWFVESNGNKIGRLSPSGALRLFTLPWPESKGDSATFGTPNGITRGADGSLWFAELGGIGQITTTGRVTVFRAAPPVPLPPGCPDPAC